MRLASRQPRYKEGVSRHSQVSLVAQRREVDADTMRLLADATSHAETW